MHCSLTLNPPVKAKLHQNLPSSSPSYAKAFCNIADSHGVIAVFKELQSTRL
jgi:hypothetical protein